MEKLINDNHKVIILSSGRKWSNIGMYEDTGDLIYNDPDKDIPRGMPVNLFVVNPTRNNLSEGDLFVLSESYDEIYYCTNIDGDSVSAGEINFNEGGYEMKRPIFTQHPLKNVRKIIGTSIQEPFFRLWNLNEDQIKEIIETYNTNSNHKMFNY